MISRRPFLLSILCVAGTLASPRFAHAEETKLSDSETSDLLEKIGSKRNSVARMKAHFSEVRTLGLLASKVQSDGSLMMDRTKNILEWAIEKPDPIVYKMSPEGLSYKSAAGEGRATNAAPKIANALSDLRSLLGGSISDLRKRYQLSAARVSDGGETRYQIFADARDPTHSTFLSFSVTLDSDLITPRHARLTETKRDFTEITFSNVHWGGPNDAR